MQYFKKDLSVLVIPLVILVLISELTLFGITVSNQRASAKSRTRNRETTLTVLRESYSTKCLLLVPNAQRVESTINKCDAEAKAKVDKLK